MSTGYILQGGRIIDPANDRDEISDIIINDTLITTSQNTSLETIDASGLLVFPGCIDLHVHLREPGNETAETIESGAQAAVKGGFTTIVAMPNTNPPIDNPDQVRAQLNEAKRIDLLNILPSGCITIGRNGSQLADMNAMAEAGAAAFTDDGSCVPDKDLMRDAMIRCKELNITLMDHSLDPDMAGNGCMRSGPTAEKLGLQGIPAEAETSIVERNIELARETGCRIHIQHVSCAKSVQLIKSARKEGLPVSGEATPHHMIFADKDIPSTDHTDYKMNPPLGTREDQQELLHGIEENTISAFATDHAPHTAESKNKGFPDAPFGVIGLETALAATYTCTVKDNKMSLTDWVSRWTTGPAEILGQPAPSLAEGQPANIAIFDPSTEWTVSAQDFYSLSSNSPFTGMRLSGKVVHTFFNGRKVF